MRERVDHPDLRGWSDKEGTTFVKPPVEVLEQLVALRIHIDPCGKEDGPLQFLARTHTRGRIDTQEASALKFEGE